MVPWTPPLTGSAGRIPNRLVDVRYVYHDHLALLWRTKGRYRIPRCYRYIGVSAQRSLSEIFRAVSALREAGSKDFRTRTQPSQEGIHEQSPWLRDLGRLGFGRRQRHLDQPSRQSDYPWP